jgi:hypothetical protein
MKRKIVGILACMLLIGTVLPVSSINIDNEIDEEKTPMIVNGENEITIYLPDIHIYYHEQIFKWADVEFDDPGAIIDVDLSELNVDDVISFNQTIIVHPVDETKVHFVFYQLDNSEYAGSKQGGIEFINEDRKWKAYQHENVRLQEIVENDYYPLLIFVAGIPQLMRLPFSLYWQFIYFNQWMWNGLFPCPVVEKRGNSVEYQIHVHT